MESKRCAFRVLPAEQGWRLAFFLRAHLEEAVSSKAIKRALDGGRCRVNGRVERFGSFCLVAKDLVEIEMCAPLPRVTRKSVEVLYEDPYLLICNKSSGVVSEPSSFPFPPLHRLDKDTTGALILAKQPMIKDKMVEQFRARKVRKEYWAIVDGRVGAPNGKIDNFLEKKGEFQGQTIWGVASKREGVRALTEWSRLASGDSTTLLQCIPVTGRTHQLRVHLSSMGHPILGDAQYGKVFTSLYKAPRYLLHAYKLSFPHPVLSTIVAVTAPLPEDFTLALQKLHMV